MALSSAAKIVVPSGNPDDVILRLEDALPTAGDLQYCGEAQKRRILDRTARGLDVDGRPFEPYSDRYAQKKTKSGRDSGTVDLTYTARMLQSVQVLATPTEFRVGIYGFDEALRAEAHNEGIGNMPRRRFFDTSESDVGDIARDLEQRVTDRLARGR